MKKWIKEFMLEIAGAVSAFVVTVSFVIDHEWWAAVWSFLTLLWVVVAYLRHVGMNNWKKRAHYWRKEYNDVVGL